MTQERGKLESRSADRAGALVGVGQAPALCLLMELPGRRDRVGLVHSASLSIGLGAGRCSVSVNQVSTGLVHKRAENPGMKQAYPLGLSMMMEMFFAIQDSSR